MVEVLGEESAKAIGKVADAAGKAIDAGTAFGRWFSKYCGYPLEQGLGLWGDKLHYRRIENLLAFMGKTSAVLDKLGIRPLRPLDLKVGIPLLEAASLEGDEYLQDLWANLFVNATTLDEGHTVERSLITTLQNMSRVDAAAFKHLYDLREQYRIKRFESFIDEMIDFNVPVDRTVLVEIQVQGNIQKKRKYKTLEDVPYLSSLSKDEIIQYLIAIGVSEEKAELSIWTLHQLGCVEVDDDHRQLAWFRRQVLYFTPLGIALYQACTLEKNANGSH